MITPAEMAYDLAAHFRCWRPLLNHHGMVVVEAHAVDPAVTARLVGRTVLTSLDATHGYSYQYPVEAEVFAWAARQAGLHSQRHLEPAADQLGYTLLTIDHFKAEAESKGSTARSTAGR